MNRKRMAAFRRPNWELQSFVCCGVGWCAVPYVSLSSLPSPPCLPLISTQGIVPWGDKLSNTWLKKKQKKMHVCHVESLPQIFQRTPSGLRVLAVTQTNENIFTSCVNNSPSSPHCSLRVPANWYSVTPRSIKPEPPVASLSVTF